METFMPLFLQALPLSLKTFWRYLAILPILGVVACLLLLASFVPLLGAVVPGTVYAYCLMTGLRCALAARGHTTDPGFGHMLRAGLVFFLLTSVVGVVLNFLAGSLSAGIVLALRAFDKGGSGEGSVWLWFGSALGLLILFMMLWSAALAVPMTAAVAGTERRSTGLNPFDGIGSGMIGLTLISLVWMAGGTVFSVFGEVTTMFFLLFETIRAVIEGEDPAWDWSLSPLSLLGGTLYMTWASSWFFSAAVLYWERSTSRRAEKLRAAVEASRVSAEDLRALREARMRNR
jgi:hypothetical protein